MADPIYEVTFKGDDWYGEHLLGREYTACTFREVDLSESVTQGVVFTDCVFGNVSFNASRHTDSAFTNCTFRRCNFFDTEFTGCKLTGSKFDQPVSLRPMRVLGGDWSFVTLAGADLRGSDLSALDPVVSDARILPEQAITVAMAFGFDVR